MTHMSLGSWQRAKWACGDGGAVQDPETNGILWPCESNCKRHLWGHQHVSGLGCVLHYWVIQGARRMVRKHQCGLLTNSAVKALFWKHDVKNMHALLALHALQWKAQRFAKHCFELTIPNGTTGESWACCQHLCLHLHRCILFALLCKASKWRSVLWPWIVPGPSTLPVQQFKQLTRFARIKIQFLQNVLNHSRHGIKQPPFFRQLLPP